MLRWIQNIVLLALVVLMLLPPTPAGATPSTKASDGTIASPLINIQPQTISVKTATHGCSSTTSCSTVVGAGVSTVTSALLAIVYTNESTLGPSTVQAHGITFTNKTSTELNGKYLGLWLATNISGGSTTVYANYSFSVTSYTSVVGVQNVTSSPLDAIGSAVSGSSTGPSASVTTTAANDYVVTAVGFDGTAAAAAPIVSSSGGSTVFGGVSSVFHSPTRWWWYGGGAYLAEASSGAHSVGLTISTSQSWEAIAIAFFATTVPPVPTGLTSGTVTASTIPLEWTDGPGDIRNETVEDAIYTSSCGAFSYHSVGAGKANQYTLSGLAAATTYCIAVESWNTTGASGFTSTIQVETVATVPNRPTNFYVTSFPSSTKIATNWTNPTNVIVTNDSVRLTSYSGVSCGSWPSWTSLGGVFSKYTFIGLVSGNSYCLEVATWNTVGVSLGAYINGTTANSPTSVPTGFAVSSYSTSSITASWTNPGGATNDTFYSTTYGSSCGAYTNISEGAVTTATLSGLLPAHAYCLKLVAWSINGPSSEVTLTKAVTAPNATTGFSVTSTTSTTFATSWTAPAGTIGNYTGQVATYTSSCGSYGSGISIGTGTTFTFGSGSPSNNLALSTGVSYCLRVAAWVDGTANNAEGAFQTVTDVVTYPSAPTSLAVTNTTQSTMALGWTNPAGTLTNLTLYQSSWNGASCNAFTFGTSFGGTINTSYTVHNLGAGHGYCFRLTAWTSGQSAADQISDVSTVPSTPGTPSYSNATTTVLKVTWANSFGTTNHQVWVGNYGQANSTCYGYSPFYTPNNYAQFNASGLSPDSGYCFKMQVRSNTYYGDCAPCGSTIGSGWTNNSSVLVDAFTLPLAPTTLVSSVVSSTKVSLTWTNTGSYLHNDSIDWGTTSGEGNIYHIGSLATSYTFTTLSASTTYYFQVYSSDAAIGSGGGASALSNQVSSTTPAGLSVSFTISYSVGEVGLTISFTSSVSGGVTPYSYSWNFGDAGGTQSTAANPTHVYASSANFLVYLNVTAGGGETVSSLQHFLVNPALVVSFIVSPTSPDQGQTATFTSTRTGGVNPYTYSWKFGDGGTSSATNPTHAYATAGSYTARINVTDTDSVLATYSLVVTVNLPLTVSFATHPATVEKGISATIISLVSHGEPPYSYVWYLGDGTHSTVVNPIHTYSSSGSFTVDENVTDADGLTVDYSHSLTVVGPPSASFSFAPIPTASNSITNFTSSVSGGAGPFSYSWRFVGPNGNGTGANTSFVFPTIGTFPVYLNVTDADGAMATVIVNVSVTVWGGKVNLDGGATGITNASLTWTPSQAGPFNNFTLGWGYSPTSFPNHISAGSSARQYNDTNLTPNSTTYWVVWPWVGGTQQAPSNVVSIHTKALLQIVLTAASINGTAVALSWTGPGVPVLNYTLVYERFIGHPIAYISVGAGTRFNLSGLAQAQYYFIVWGWTAYGQTPYSNTAVGTTVTPGSGSSPAPFPWGEVLAITVVFLLAGIALSLFIGEVRHRRTRRIAGLALYRSRPRGRKPD